MDITTEALRLGMAMARARVEVASDNIANVDTPGYHAQRADFGRSLGLVGSADHAHTAGAELGGGITMTDDIDPSVHLDGEVAELESASASYQEMTMVLSRRFALMQLALAGRN